MSRLQMNLTVWFVCSSATLVAHAATEALWLSPRDGAHWSDASHWSTDPIVPANGFPAEDDRYNVVFDTSSDRPYLVLMSAQELSLDGLSIIDPMTLHQSGGTVRVGQLEIQSGSYRLSDGATLRDTIIHATGGLLEVVDGEVADAAVYGHVLLTAQQPAASSLRNVHFEDAVVESQGAMSLGGRIDGVGVISLGDRVDVTEPTVIGPQVTLVVADNSSVWFRDRDEFLLYGELEAHGAINFGLLMRNYGRITIYEGGTVSQSRLRQSGDPQPGRWLIHSGGQLVSPTRFELGSGGDLTMILGSAVNDPLIQAWLFAADGVLRLRIDPSYMPRTDRSLQLVRVERTINGSFREIDLGKLPAGFSWDTSDLLTTGEISFQGPPVTRVAYTEFEEPPLNALSYVAGAGSAELGFETTYAFNDGNRPAAGVNDLPGERALSFQSLDTTTTFDTVSVVEYANTAVDVRFTVSDTGYEDDFVELTLHSSDGDQKPISAVFDLGYVEDAAQSVYLLSANVPSDWTDATIEIKTKTDSSSGAERVNLHSVNVVGFEYLDRMERPGDFVVDGMLNPKDLRKLDVALSRGSKLDVFDLDGNGQFEAADRLYWIEELWGSFVGDANVDGEFNSSDMVAVFQLGEYEDQMPENSNWQSGDWDGDRDFSTSDMVLAFQRGGYEQGLRGALNGVPEPSSLALLLTAVFMLSALRGTRKTPADQQPFVGSAPRQRPTHACLATVAAIVIASVFIPLSQADIVRWDNRELIPGTQGLTPGPAAQLDGKYLAFADLDGANLAFANLQSANLQHARLRSSVLTDANLSQANLAAADVVAANIAGADVSAANLTGAFLQWADFTGATLAEANLTDARLQWSTLTDANLTNAIVVGTDFRGGTVYGLTADQLYLTAGYQQKNLRGIGLADNDLTGWDFSQQNLSHADFRRAALANALYSGASVRDAQFDDVTSKGFRKEQLYSTASYQERNLHGIGLNNNDLVNWDFSRQDLTGASMSDSVLIGADLSGAIITGVDFGNTTTGQLTENQLQSTSSYQMGDLRHVNFQDNNLDGWDFEGQDLAGASFLSSSLIGVNMRQANLANTGFFLAKMDGADLRDTNLSDSNFDHARLTSANLSGADLTGADLQLATLTGAILTNATLEWTDLSGTAPNGFSPAQLYSTASYQNKNLIGIQFGTTGSNLTDRLAGWSFRGQNLAVADFSESRLESADLREANLKNANFLDVPDLDLTIFNSGTTYNQWTAFPDGFDPLAAGLTFQRSPEGDFDTNGGLDAVDIQILSERIHDPFRFPWLDGAFDVNSDSQVDKDDLRTWVSDLKATYFGDADLNGEFTSSDMVQVFTAGKYETGEEATWAEGDWNGDGGFDSSDMVTAFGDGGYEKGPRTNAAAVPEATSVLLLVTGLIGVSILRHRLRL